MKTRYTTTDSRVAGAPPEPVPLGFARFTANGDYLHVMTRVCLGCGSVVAAEYTDVHLGVCVAREVTQ